MALKVDHATSVEPRPPQISVGSSPATSTGNTKVSKFGMKSGFVIPKNKLSGSLVPVFKGGGKVESSPVKEESIKQVQRKTKWGTDLTQDATVQKGRALAYQTRVEQITKQLESGVLEKGEEDFRPQSPVEVPDESSRPQADHQKLEILELEKREAIGEILKLNPSYKAPPDYKPVMKEASIPVPVKLYPGLNFVGLILGPGSNTQKRLEEETGAKIRIQGTKAGSTEKVEITSSDKNDVQGFYEELYVHVLADTFEKVDAAVGLIELLVTPVSGNSGMVPPTPSSVSGDGANVLEQQHDATPGQVMPGAFVNQGVMQTMAGPMQPGFFPQVQYHQYPATWFPAGQMRPPNNFGPPSNSSIPTSSVMQYPTLNPSNMQQFLVGQPPSAAGSAMGTRNPSLVSPRLQQPPQGFQWPYFREAPPNGQGHPPRMQGISGPQLHVSYPSIPTQPNPSVRHQGTLNHQRTTGPGPGSMMLTHSQPLPTAPSGHPPHMPQSSSGWSASSAGTPSQPVLFQGAPVSRPQMSSVTTASNMPSSVMSGPSGNMISPGSFPPRPSTAHLPNALVNSPIVGPNFSFVIHQRSPLASNPVTTVPVASMPARLPSSAPSSTLGPSQAPPSVVPQSPAAQSPFPRVSGPGFAQAPAAPALSLPHNQSSPGAHMQPVGSDRPPNQSMVGSAQVPQSLPSSVSANSTNFTSPKPPPTSSPQSVPATAPKPHRPSSGDFTFRPLGSPLPVSPTVPKPSDQPSQAPSVPPNSLRQPPPQQPPPPPHTSTYRPAPQNSGPQPVMQGFPTNRPGNQMIQSQPEVRPPSLNPAPPFTGNPSPFRSPRFSEYANPNSVPPTGPSPHPGPRSYTQAPQMSNFPGRFPPQMMNPPQMQQNQSPRMMNPPQMQQNQMGAAVRPGNFLGPNQHYGNNPAFSTGRPASSPSGNQVYDPFSPTSAPPASQQPENPAKVRKQEDDPEYDDLMASVGVR